MAKRIILMLIIAVFTFADSYLQQANARYENGEFGKAVVLYKKAIVQGENPALCYFNLANTWFQMDSLSQAIVYYSASIDAAPDFFMSHLNLAVTYYMLDEIGECIALLNRALELEPDNTKAHKILASAYLKAGSLERAAVLFEQIHEKNQEDHEVSLSLGEIYRELDDPVEATKWLMRYPAGGQHYTYTQQTLSELYENQGDINKAIFYLRKVCEVDKKNRWAHYQLIVLLKEAGNSLVALSEAEKALEIFTDFHELALLAGNIAFENNQIGKAERHYILAKKLGNPGAIIGLENIRILHATNFERMH